MRCKNCFERSVVNGECIVCGWPQDAVPEQPAGHLSTDEVVSLAIHNCSAVADSKVKHYLSCNDCQLRVANLTYHMDAAVNTK